MDPLFDVVEGKHLNKWDEAKNMEEEEEEEEDEPSEPSSGSGDEEEKLIEVEK